uniref:Diacylglycerol kinase n=1 Tax=Guillardia theta TaxID=55529 RepID=A0A7S4PPD8_GUITH|mmetsp:Transcript_8340/g.28034  ORF Transcript_8340/g.28034 Transcript_8340/m.28034 type:complete len:495 (+) Transcript_8340:27-1511(+)
MAEPKAAALMRGWLEKQHHHVLKSFERRWFELYGCELRYFEKDRSDVACRVINVKGNKFQDGRKTAKRLEFVIETPNDTLAKSYKFACDKEEEYNQWKAALAQAAVFDRATVAIAPQRPNIVALVNGKSGGKQGTKLIQKIKKHLGDANVVDIMSLSDAGKGIKGPHGALAMHANDGPNTRFLVCGGDGTVGWTLQDMEKLIQSGGINADIPIAVLPLGTGNDMARTLRCGGGYSGEQLLPILKKAAVGERKRLDRWKVRVTAEQGGQEPFVKEFLMCNYFSIGWDAVVARGFHVKRELSPNLFKNRIINKLWYLYFSFGNLVGNFDASKGVELEVDGKSVQIPKGIKSVAVINIPSFSGGADLWGKSSSGNFQKPQTDDGLLEIVGTYNPLHLGMVIVKIRTAVRIAQGKRVTVKTKTFAEGGPKPGKGTCMQVDGEPYFLDHKGFHEDVHYKPEKNLRDGNVDVKVEISHHAVATLVESPDGGGCCVAPKVD